MSIAHHFADGVYAKEMTLLKDNVIGKHVHTYDHLSVLACGQVLVYVDDEDPIFFEAPACVIILAGKTHAIRALTDATWFCIHATDETDPDKVDQVLIGD